MHPCVGHTHAVRYPVCTPTHFRMLKDKSVSSEVMIAITIRSQSIVGFLDNGEPIHMSKLFSEHDSEEQDEDDFDGYCQVVSGRL